MPGLNYRTQEYRARDVDFILAQVQDVSKHTKCISIMSTRVESVGP